MPPPIATLVFALGILGLFALDRDPKVRTSKALWIPVLWLLIIESRSVSQWLQMVPVVDSPDAVLDGSPLDAFVFAALLLVGLAVMLTRGRRVGTILQSNGPLILFFAYCAISILWSDFPFVAFKRWTKAVAELVMVLIVLTDPHPGTAIKRVLARTAFVLLPASILLIRYYPDLGRVYDRWEGNMFIVGVTTNKNSLGVLCLICGLGFLWRLMLTYRAEKSALRTKQLVSQGILLALAMWLLSTANSMTSLACFVLAGSLLVLTSFRAVARSRAMIHTLVIALLLVAFSPLFLAFGSGFVEMLGRDSTLTGRTEIWSLVLGLAGNPLFGTGFESYWLGERLEKLWSVFHFPLNEAHNGYIEVYLNLGWAGIALLAVAAMAGYRSIIRSFQHDPDAARLRLAYFFTALAYSVSEVGFRILSPTWMFFLFAVTSIPLAVSQVASEWDSGAWQLWPAEANPSEATANQSARPLESMTRKVAEI